MEDFYGKCYVMITSPLKIVFTCASMGYDFSKYKKFSLRIIIIMWKIIFNTRFMFRRSNFVFVGLI